MSVFLSYSRSDSEFVDLLYRLLASKGYETWMDRRDIEAGSRWDMEVQQAIDDSSHVVIVLTPQSATSQNVSDEWSYALDEQKTLIPLIYRSCTIPMRLRRMQWIDFAEQSFDSAFSNLTSALGEPDNRPTDPIELAKREGLIFVDTRTAFGMGGLRVAFDYRDYPQVGPFLATVWQTLLSRVIEPHMYGVAWYVEDKTTGRKYLPPENEQWSRDLLLHEVGIEPGTQLHVIVVDDEARMKGSISPLL